jgi:hypothetical protein
MRFKFYILLFLMSLLAEADEIPLATREHLARLRAMAVSLSQDPAKAAALGKIEAEIERISTEYKISLEVKPKAQADFRKDPLEKELQDFARLSVARGGLGMSPEEARGWALYNIGRGMDGRALTAFKERYGFALAFGLRPFSAAGFGFQFEEEAARWAEKMAREGRDLRPFVAVYEPALRFAGSPRANGGLGLELKNGDARGWAESAATRFSRADLTGFIARYQLALGHAQASLLQGGLGLGDRAAADWAMEQATRFSLGDLEAKIRPKPGSLDPYRRAGFGRERCGKFFDQLI